MIDVENRANYIALRKRWEVLDKTITFPEDEMGGDSEPYMDHSEDECEQDDSNSLAPPTHYQTTPTTHQEVCSSYEPTTVCRTCGKSCGVAGTGGVAGCGGVAGEACLGCTSSNDRAVGDEGGGAEGDRGGGAEGDDRGGTSFTKSCYLCEHAQYERRRFSTSGVLDEDGLGMLSILELTSRVSYAFVGGVFTLSSRGS